jgi:hypothetical protein
MIPEAELHASLRYLESDEALESLAADAYWPKWDSPWWHMRLLHELGETKLIPKAAIRAHVEALDRMPVKFFPFEPGELPEGVDPYRGTPCTCQLGTVYQVLAAWGVDVDPSFLGYAAGCFATRCPTAALPVTATRTS